LNSDFIEPLEESGRWRARDVSYWAGRWDQLYDQMPKFKSDDFRVSPKEPPNPYMKVIVRQPRKKYEQPIPVGVVSNTYTLAQHSEVAEKCFNGIQNAGIETGDLRCELGLTELGEWMNLRIYFPDEYSHKPKDGEKLLLRLECFNSVDGSSRLVILLGWLRFICSNGMVIGETKAELRDIHNKHMDLKKIPDIICEGLKLVQADLDRMNGWEEKLVKLEGIKTWANGKVSESWGKRAACRVFHICKSGFDVKITDPFAAGSATEKPVERIQDVPGAQNPSKNLFHVSQALSWVATSRRNPEERLSWQEAIPRLINALQETV